jgi:2,5-diketo-D-gluconate reductase A
MDRLGLDYLDLDLIHWQLPASNEFVDAFKAFAHLRDQGRIRSIGVGNFGPEHLTVLIDATGIVPAVNQIELHPRFPQQELRGSARPTRHCDRGVGAAGEGSAVDASAGNRRRRRTRADTRPGVDPLAYPAG